ncbi:extracellular solute-binding protein [Actinopolymorpha pittospori]|uniref:Aldouronate transport system substrate-binding protein n=1 Tax=Actinopolymorpha pittospori TaxID=648752 RepID=A0A927RKV2_9ACTN|nr:extracellular solute-binding protein [Actinopolymorpha pittospori]MBE1608596.1 putative aldouronate transport system substrate-binding protein [Actinopolymorpha pittospori]
MTQGEISRRGFLRGVGGAALVAGGSAAVGGCGGGDGLGQGGGARAGSDAAVRLPAYAPKTAVEADLPALPNGTPGALLRYPAAPKRMYEGPPAHGGTIDVLKMIDGAPPPPVQRNPFWQQLNKRVGAELQLNNVIASDYSNKLATLLASGDLPDLVQLPTNVPHLPDVLAKEFQDLSEWVSGDAVKNYTGLPAMSEVSWKNVAFNGGIWGVPWQLGLPASVLEIRQDLVEEKGLTGELHDGQDFLDLCAALTDPDHQRWAIGTPSTALNIVREMVGVPNNWKQVDGEFTSMYETEEYRRALDIIASLWKKGYIIPDSMNSTAPISDWFGSGRVAMSAGGYTNWALYITANKPTNPKFTMGCLVPPKWEGGGQAAHWVGNGMYTFTAVRKASKARVEELLRVLDWFAAPFGSEEYTFRRYGVPGRDYTVVKGEPAVTRTGTNEVQNMAIGYVATCPLLLYIPGQPEATRDEYDALSALMKVTVANPTVGLFSDSALTAGLTSENKLLDLQNGIIFGREPLSAWDEGVRSWRSGGGDQVRSEYEKAFAAANK